MSEASTVSTTEMKSDISTPEESASPNCLDSAATAPSVAVASGGTQIPNRVFVGGIAVTMTESELFDVFANFGRVRTARIIHDKGGRPKGYGFVTYVSEAEAKWVHDNMPYVYFGQRRLNVAPAIKKQVPSGELSEESVECGVDKVPLRPASNNNRRRRNLGASGLMRRGGLGPDPALPEISGSGGVAWTGSPICFWQPGDVPRQAIAVDTVNVPQIHCADYSVPAATWSTCRPHDYSPIPVPPSIPPQLCCPLPLPMPYLVVPQAVYPPGGDRLLPPIFVQGPNTAYCTPRQDKATESAMWKLVTVPGSC